VAAAAVTDSASARSFIDLHGGSSAILFALDAAMQSANDRFVVVANAQRKWQKLWDAEIRNGLRTMHSVVQAATSFGLTRRDELIVAY
jgi:hypothetical protein